MTGIGRHHYCWEQFLVLLILWLLSLCLKIWELVKSWAQSLKENLWWTTGINNCSFVSPCNSSWFPYNFIYMCTFLDGQIFPHRSWPSAPCSVLQFMFLFYIHWLFLSTSLPPIMLSGQLLWFTSFSIEWFLGKVLAGLQCWNILQEAHLDRKYHYLIEW